MKPLSTDVQSFRNFQCQSQEMAGRDLELEGLNTIDLFQDDNFCIDFIESISSTSSGDVSLNCEDKGVPLTDINLTDILSTSGGSRTGKVQDISGIEQYQGIELTSTADNFLQCLLPGNTTNEDLENMIDLDVIESVSLEGELEEVQDSCEHQQDNVQVVVSNMDDILQQCQEYNLATLQSMTPILSNKVDSLHQTANDKGVRMPRLQEENSSNDDLVLPVHILRLLQDHEDNVADDIKEFLESNETSNKKKETKSVQKSQIKKHPSHCSIKCQICDGKATGFHYGADVCTGCRLFFFRNHKISPKHNCQTKRGKGLMPCMGCRMEKCVKVGMNIKNNRKGRYSYKRMHEYAVKKTEAEKAIVQNVPVQPESMANEINILAARISEVSLSCENEMKTGIEYTGGHELALNTLYPLAERLAFPEVYVKRYAIGLISLEYYLRFAKQLAGYHRIPQTERWEVFLRGFPYLEFINHFNNYDVQKGLEFHLNGTIASKQEMQENISPEYAGLVFSIVERLQKLNLDENEKNLLKLVGFFANHHTFTEKTQMVASKEQDIMIRAFDYLVRKNRKNNTRAAVVIGNAMQILCDVMSHIDLMEKDFNNQLDRYPPHASNWLRKTFIFGHSRYEI